MIVEGREAVRYDGVLHVEENEEACPFPCL
jgi:hypothetical protein